MRLAREGRNDNLSDLDMPISALYQVTARSTPPAVRDAVIEKARTAKVTYRETNEAVRASRPITEPRIVETRSTMNGLAEMVASAVTAPELEDRAPRSTPNSRLEADARKELDVLVAISVHFLNRQRRALLMPLPTELRERLLSCLKDMADQVNDFIADVEAIDARQ